MTSLLFRMRIIEEVLFEVSKQRYCQISTFDTLLSRKTQFCNLVDMRVYLCVCVFVGEHDNLSTV